MKYFFSFFIFLFFNISLFAYSRTYTYYTGTIGKFPIEMTLWTSDSINDMGGFYHYLNQRGMLELSGTYDAKGNFSMEERLNSGGTVTGIFSGKYVKNISLDGTWKNKEETKSFPFHLLKATKGGVEITEGRAYTDTAFTISTGDTVVTEMCDLHYLKIDYANATVSRKINNSIFMNNYPEQLENYSEMKWHFPQYNELARDFTIHSWKEICKFAINDEDTMSARSNQNSWQWESASKLIWNGSGVLCIGFFRENYMGGERPFYENHFCCYNLATGDSIKLKQIFLPGYKKDLLKAIAKNIDNDGPGEIDNEPIPLTDNFSITPLGIEFWYNYELGSYSTGICHSLVLWSELNQWIDPKGPMSWVKK
jgi:hypothetical protein